jgi:hypothetical protein
MIKGRLKYIAAAIAMIGLLLTAFALLNPSGTGADFSGMMGAPVSTSSYSMTDMLLAIIGAAMAAVGATYILFKEDYEPLVDLPLITRPNLLSATAIPPVVVESMPETSQEAGPETAAVPSDVVDERLVLRLLTGDERAMFRVIVESGGEALQKDLIIKTKMSDAKVSRTLDKLVEKGVISKVRHGITNKVRVEIEP